MKAVILAGGLGTRLRPYTFMVPKPMLPLGDKPILEHIVCWLSSNGVKDIIIATGYLAHIIEDYFGNGTALGPEVSIRYVRSSKPLSQGGQLKTVEKMVGKEAFVVTYGDVITDLDLEPLVKFHKEKGGLATLVARKLTTTSRFGVLHLGSDSSLKEWEEKPRTEALVNAGIYVFEPRIFDYIPENKVVSMDKVFQEAMAKDEKAYVYVSDANFIDIGDTNSYRVAVNEYTRRLGGV
ncbi:MAG: nucleotidyltransferase family protein [Candidatus Brockarchaeota archaeon]|nr:nucleotidyltransferase family protein [Candidatus Brockarchaeota archaeon]